MFTVLRTACALVLGLGAATAQAVTMDFDGICPAPPCLVTGKYPGVTFNPGTLQIVGPGTDGLTGPAGGAYLSVPAGVTVQSAKDMMSASVKVSRASTSAGPVTVYAIMSKNGSQVAPAWTVDIAAVDQWVDFPFGSLLPFDTIFIGANGAPIGLDALQLDVRCFGFADVQPQDAYCDAVEWIANRNVTLGCAAGVYCPGAAVTRAQMALFMQRLADAIAPEVQRADCVRSSTFAPLQRGCIVVVDAVSWPRVATTHMSCGLQAASPVTKAVASDIVASGDGGSTWTATGNGSFAALAGSARAGVSNVGTVDIPAGSGRHFAYELAHVDGDAAATLTVECTLVVTVGSRTGTSSPY